MKPSLKPSLKLLFVALLLTGCSDPVLWNEAESHSAQNGTRITRIELVRETCHLVTFNVGYYNDGSRSGYLRAGINAGIKDAYWPDMPKLKVGNHIVELQAGIQGKAQAQKSAEIAVSIEQIDKNIWQGYVDRRTVEYRKEWSNDCR